MGPLTVGLLHYWTIAMFNIIYQYFCIFPTFNIYLDYWTTALFDVLYQYSYTFTRTQEALYCWTIGPLDYPLIYIFTCKDIDFATVQ